VRATNCVTVTASGSVCVVTAGGKALGPYSGPGKGMEKWLGERLKAWEALPDEARKPGAIQAPGSKTIDPRRAAVALPPGTLVVRVFNRHLGWNADRSLRYAVAEDYLPGTSPSEVERYAMAQNDFLWLPEKEWRALVPAEPRIRTTHPVPATFALRLLRFHLDPARGFTEGANFTRSRSDAGQLTLTVQEATDDKVLLMLQGKADLKQVGRDEPASYQPALRGYLEYDRRKQSFTRFDLLALGTTSGLPCDANGKVSFRKGAYPVGIAFELVANPSAGERLHPRGARDNPAAYLNPQEKR
jgi:hypothetical protein